MIFERTKYGEVMALARLLNIEEEILLHCAKRSQPDITDLSQIDDSNYNSLMEMLLLFANAEVESAKRYEEEAEEREEFRQRWERMTPYEQRMWRYEQTADERYDSRF